MNYSLTKKKAKELIENKLLHYFGISPKNATYEHFYRAVSMIIRDMMASGRADFTAKAEKNGAKRVYYVSMEFLLGRSLKNNLSNLGLEHTVESALRDFDIDIERLYDCEPDAGLGNGGLGRLAGAYLDSMATEGYVARGYSILYEYGIFKQKLIDGWQTELPDSWLPGGDVWLVDKEESAVEVRFDGWVEESWDGDFHRVEQKGCNVIKAVPHDMFISGKDGKGISVLRLWSAEAPGLDMKLFNEGDYLKASEQNAMAEVISKILYPSDNHAEGKSLRLKQQYFLSSASAQDMIRHHLHLYGTLDNLPEKIAIQINDTHPTLIIPEMMRILMDECGYSWDDAWNLVTNTVSYTNHTVMKEALECWTEELVSQRLPRIYQIIREIDNRWRSFVWNATGDSGCVERTAVISGRDGNAGSEGRGVIRMANLCCAACHSVNGVSKLHSGLLKTEVFSDFYRLTPDKFKNVTNGITYRRWLCQADPELSSLVKSLIGDGFERDASELVRLKEFAGDAAVLEQVGAVKRASKERLAAYIKSESGVILDPDSIFDVQVKRLHEYKRQQMNAMNILQRYLEIKADPNGDWIPHTYIFGAKAAPGYFVAKKIIEFIVSLQNLVNNDPVVSKYMKVCFIENYNVSAAELIMPAADISEQISLAGTEASGTGCMKLMLDGAVTLGTLDGANIEIKDAVGDDNIVIFGMTADEAKALKASGYKPKNYVMNNDALRMTIDYVDKNGVAGKPFGEISGTIVYHDPYMILADYADYDAARRRMEKMYLDRPVWERMSLMNTASAGIFSSDRAVSEYASLIWNTKSGFDPAPKAPGRKKS
ncbi:MAG: glycogen/starch/alpha-glucan phosphorylase [Clostridia bacterium]|nr:glycogen/starch/alpha-glucan phosphorylase [Clostridia bacterium]